MLQPPMLRVVCRRGRAILSLHTHLIHCVFSFWKILNWHLLYSLSSILCMCVYDSFCFWKTNRHGLLRQFMLATANACNSFELRRMGRHCRKENRKTTTITVYCTHGDFRSMTQSLSSTVCWSEIRFLLNYRSAPFAWASHCCQTNRQLWAVAVRRRRGTPTATEL